MISLWKSLTRKKQLSDEKEESNLARVLTLFDLISLGVGSTLGLGVYVLAGSVAYDVAGPAVVVSFTIAAIASTFAGLCYAEFAARVPKAGSAYIYSYVTIGEFVAFLIGWNMLLEYAIGTSSVARGMSSYVDVLVNNTMAKTLRNLMPMNYEFLAEYPDIFSFVIIMSITILMAVGVKESTRINNIFTIINMCTIVTVLVAGLFHVNPDNWRISKESIPLEYASKAGNGGFMPFGIAGIAAGAAKCFYGFVGFDCVATTGEEAKKPERNVPLSIIISLVIIFIAYFGISTVLTMMWPYYMQDPIAPFPHVFNELGWTTIKWIVTIGALFALANSLVGSFFPIPRVVYSMALDGLVYNLLSKVNTKTKTPIYSTIFCGLLASIMALIFNLEQLIDMMSIGTLLAYTIVAASVLILRYRDDSNYMVEITETNSQVFRQLLNLNFIKKPNSLSSKITIIGVSVFGGLSIIFCVLINYIDLSNKISIGAVVILVAAMILTMLIIGRQPVENSTITFKTPFVPLLPCLSILINLLLMFQLDPFTWARLLAWIVIGCIIYFTYGIKNSVECESNKVLELKISSPGSGGGGNVINNSIPSDKLNGKSYNL